MKNVQIEKLLAIAGKLPGYQKRFREAGLYDRNDKIIPDWPTAFQRLRPLDREEVRQNPSLFLANASDVVYRGITGGTRGKSLVYFAGDAWNSARIAAREKTLSWWGIDTTIPILNVASRLLPVRWKDGSLIGKIDREFIELFVRLLKDRFKVIRGYPSQLCEIAAYLYDRKLPQVKAVICTGECLFSYQMALLKSVFNTPIINEYGCQETGISGLTCPEKGSLHLDEERCFYEVVAGELVTTDLLNLTMPMIRYKCGDILELQRVNCSYDRMSLTAKIKGRREDKIRTLTGNQYAGEIELPTLEGILNYQVRRREKKQVEFLLQPIHRDRFSLDNLKNWTDRTFGEIEAQVYIRSRDIIETKYEFCSDREWIEKICDRPWYEWLNSPQFPIGEAKKAADLLYELINPRLILYSGIAPSTEELINDILNSSPCQDREVEKITARILLFSCSFLAEDSRVFSIYQHATERLKRVIVRGKKANDSALLDLLIPSLYLKEELARSLWDSFPFELKRDRIILDRLNIQNFLYSFEPAWYLATRKRNKISQSLKPLLSVLIGDLEFFSSHFYLDLLAYWSNLVQGIEIVNFTEKQIRDRFFTAWLQWRKAMLEDRGEVGKYFHNLQSVVETKAEKAKICLEQGYYTLFLKQQFNVREWLPILQKYAGLKNSNRLDSAIDSASWIPILRSLAQPLFDAGRSDLAYQCLLLSALPSSRQSAFDRRTKEVNQKQSILCDLINN
jgi:phenylacetate-CoA ligase